MISVGTQVLRGTSSSVAAADITDAGAAGVALVQAATAAAARATLEAPAVSTTGAVFVLDPDDAGSVTLSSGRVSAIASQVGALSFSQATAGKRPLRVAGALNGRAIVHHDAVRTDSLVVTSALLEVADPILLTVCRVTTHNGYSQVFGTNEPAPIHARWSLWCSSSSQSDLRIDTNIAVTTITRSGETLERWAVIAYRPSVRQVYSDGRLVADAGDRAITYPSGPYESAIGFGGQWSWMGVFDAATALAGTTFADWSLSQTAALARRFGLQVRPS